MIQNINYSRVNINHQGTLFNSNIIVKILLMSYFNSLKFSTHHTAISLVVIAFLVLPAIDAIAKFMSTDISAGQIAWTRFLIQTLIMLPFFLNTMRLKKNHSLFPQALRGILIAATTVLIFAAVKLMPLAEVISIFFIEPLIVTLLSTIFLREKIGWRRLSATIIGFSGALIVVQPSYKIFGLFAILPFAAALCFAFYIILTRKLAHTINPTAMQFSSGFSGLLFMSIVLALGYFLEFPVLKVTMPSQDQCLLLLLLGLIATVGHFMIAFAIKYIEASTLAPFQYLEIVAATFYGLWLFDDFPDALAWLGIFIIVSSGCYTFSREQRKTGNYE